MPIRVLIVDDSPLVREVLRFVLGGAPDLEVIGEAANGMRALALVHELRPDVVTMDVLMPLLGGIDALGRIMAERPTPVVVVTDPREDRNRLAARALGAGAVDVFLKPPAGFDEAASHELRQLVRRAAGVRLSGVRPAVTDAPRRAPREATTVVGIVGSTGAPRLLYDILGALPPRFPWPIAIVQHTARGFAVPLASWLAGGTALKVGLAENGQRLRAGEVVLAPDDLHLRVHRGLIVELVKGPPVDGHLPSATVLLSSLAQAAGVGALGVGLTGMGRDGAEGAAVLAAAGGLLVVENPQTAVLPGMPGEALARVPKAMQAEGAEVGALLASFAGLGP